MHACCTYLRQPQAVHAGHWCPYEKSLSRPLYTGSACILFKASISMQLKTWWCHSWFFRCLELITTFSNKMYNTNSTYHLEYWVEEKAMPWMHLFTISICVQNQYLLLSLSTKSALLLVAKVTFYNLKNMGKRLKSTGYCTITGCWLTSYQ